MIEDVGTMESSDEEEERAKKPLALPMPSYSEIASKVKTYISKDEQQQAAASVIAAPGPHVTLVVAEEEENQQINDEVDDNGFKSVISKQDKRLRKKSQNSFSENLDQNLTNPVIGEEWMIDDVGTMESSDDEEVGKSTMKDALEKQSKTALETEEKNNPPTRPVIGEEWMIDDVGTMESSDDEEITESTKTNAPKKQANHVFAVEEKKKTPAKPTI